MTLNRILIIKFWAMGDVVMATPMLDALRRHNPNIHISWLTDSKNYDLLKDVTSIDQLISIDTGEWRKMLKKGDLLSWLSIAGRFRRQMREGRYDAVINCHPDKWWTVVFCCAARSVALFPFEAPFLSRLFYTASISRPTKPAVHNTIHYLLATRSLGVADGSLAMTVGEAAVTLPARSGPDMARRIIVVAPFSTAENRNWPPDRYALLIKWLISEKNAHVLVVGSAQQTADVDSLLTKIDSDHVTRADRLTVGEYVNAIKSSDLVISGDSSPMHLSAALDVPFVALFGATPVDERAPLHGRGVAIYKPVECSPCDRGSCANAEFRKCMNQIMLAEVQSAVEKLLSPDGGVAS